MADDKRQSLESARALSSVVARAQDMDPPQVLAALDEIESTYVAKVAASNLQLETRRRIAEWKFKLLSERNLPFGEVERLYGAVRELGYTNLEVEATIEIYFAQYCTRQSRTDLAERTLEGLDGKLDRAAAVTDSSLYQQLKREVQQLLSRIKE